MQVGQQKCRPRVDRVIGVLEDAVLMPIARMGVTVAAVQGRMLVRQLRRRTTVRRSAEQHGAGRQPLQGNGKQQQPDQGGTETSHAAESNFPAGGASAITGTAKVPFGSVQPRNPAWLSTTTRTAAIDLAAAIAEHRIAVMQLYRAVSATA